MKGKIICGFAGIGKSHLARCRAGVADLESTPFEKDWKRYVKVAKHMADSGYIVLLSCHRELREELRLQKIDYTVALPPKDFKEDYILRYQERGNNDAFIDLLEDNWDSFLKTLPNEKVLIVKRFLTDAPY